MTEEQSVAGAMDGYDAVQMLRDALNRHPSPSAMLGIAPFVLRSLYRQAREETEADGVAARLLAVCEIWGATADQRESLTVSRGQIADILDAPSA